LIRLSVLLLLISAPAWAVRVLPLPVVFPENEALAPSNTKIWIFDGDFEDFVLLRADGTEVVVSRQTITAPGLTSLTVLTPEARLSPGPYALTSARLATSFTVTDEVDTTPPAPLEATVTSNGAVGRTPSNVLVSVPGNTDLLFLVQDFVTWPLGSAVSYSHGEAIGASNVAPGTVTLKLLQVDLAGNATEGTMLTANVPEPRACSVSPAVPFSLLALALIRRRVRRGR
jgi:hypothetical protein